MRWKALIPITIIIAGICVFTIFFLDGVIKRAIIGTGEAIFGAKVEVGQVKFKLKDFSLDVRGLAIADKDDPWKNLIEVAHMRGQLTPSQLLYKKFIINEMSAEGMSWGGVRTTSGELPKRQQKKKEEGAEKGGAFEKLKAEIKLPDIKMLEQRLDIKKLVSPETLAAVKKAEEIKTNFKAQSEAWKKSADEAKARAQEVERAAAQFKDMQDLKVKRAEDIPKAKAKLDELQKARQTFENARTEIREKGGAVKKDLDIYQGYIKEIDGLRDKDFKDILAQLDLGGLDVAYISQAVLGPVVVSKAMKIREYAGLLKQYMPAGGAKAGKTEVKRERMKGIDVRFPLKRTYPGFLIEKMSVSGLSQAVNFAGNVSGITSDPGLYGKPARMNIAGSRGGTALSVRGVVDHTREAIGDVFEFTVKGVDLTGNAVSGGRYLNHEIKSGTGELSAKAAIKDDSWEVDFVARAGKVKLESKERTDDRVKQMINEVLGGLDAVTVEGKVYEARGDMDFSLRSNIDELIKKKIKAMLGKKLDEAKEKIRKEIDARVAAKKKELAGMINDRKSLLEKEFHAGEKVVQAKLDMVQAKIREGEDAIKKQGQEKLDKQKQKGKGELKKILGR